MSVTRLGVSLAKVVATMENPASHHGTERPETKNSEVLFPARLLKKSAGTKHSRSVATTMIQSIVWRCMEQEVSGNAGFGKLQSWLRSAGGSPRVGLSQANLTLIQSNFIFLSFLSNSRASRPRSSLLLKRLLTLFLQNVFSRQ